MLVAPSRAGAIGLRLIFPRHSGPAGATVAAPAQAGEAAVRAFYRHTQTGHLIRWGMILPATGLFAAAYFTRQFMPFVPIALVLVVLGWMFSSLTVEVTPTQLIWFFGPGLLRKSLERENIASASPVRNPWWYGWGIHRTPRGWLYNVDGLDAVEIALSGGRTLRIGSDEPRELVRALS